MRRALLGAVTAATIVVATVQGGAPALAAANPDHLPWRFPISVTGGQPVPVASILPCPAPPNPGDPILAQVNLLFAGGGSGQILMANPDGSWSGDVTFYLFNAPGSGTISVTCGDWVGYTAIPYASYQAHLVAIHNATS